MALISTLVPYWLQHLCRHSREMLLDSRQHK
ncbi:hypothetical protein NM2000080_2141 [Neisseria meningitidis 2000080]|nr:hypothetical protein NM2000080_2141 [Neisseria meningitidis 2000080]